MSPGTTAEPKLQEGNYTMRHDSARFSYTAVALHMVVAPLGTT